MKFVKLHPYCILSQGFMLNDRDLRLHATLTSHHLRAWPHVVAPSQKLSSNLHRGSRLGLVAPVTGWQAMAGCMLHLHGLGTEASTILIHNLPLFCMHPTKLSSNSANMAARLDLSTTLLFKCYFMTPSSMMNEFTNIDTTNTEPSNPEGGGPKNYKTIRVYIFLPRSFDIPGLYHPSFRVLDSMKRQSTHNKRLGGGGFIDKVEFVVVSRGVTLISST